jgi:1A family penicillin-binding protein
MKKKPPIIWRWVKLAFKTVLLLCLVGVVVTAVLFAYVAKDLPGPEAFAARKVAESTKIYDRTGTVLLYDIHGEEKRTVVASSDIPDAIKKATVAVEDDNFYNHIGVEPKAILRAALANIRNRSITQGGSTITQQLVGNTLTNRKDRTIFRKIKDTILAIELERKYSKDEILTFYLNEIPYGSNAYGVEAASQTYFGKHSKDLDLAQAATLAALPKAPTYYSPYGTHKDALATRKNFILSRMKELGSISADEYESAKNENVDFLPSRQEIKAPHFVFYVREQLADIYGEQYLEEGGLKIITSIDWDLQQKAEEMVKSYALKNEKAYKANNAALVAINPKNGDVIAMVGSRDYFDTAIDGNFNVATSRNRQPGSSFKPFAYVTAFAKGFTPDTMLFDLETNFGVEGAAPYTPQNYDGNFRGPVSMRQSLAQSLNVPSVKTLYLAGVENTIQTAESVGITTLTDRKRYGLSLVLGGGEIMLLEETGAYATFANDGLFSKVRPILSIQDMQGDTIKNYDTDQKQAIDAEASRQITDILSDNNARAPMFGAQSALYLGPDIPVAAKTGTTQENRDAWVMGYTTGITTGVWVGNNDNSPMTQKGAGISAAGPLWNEFMKFAAKTYAAEAFVKPQPVATDKPVLDGKIGGETVVQIDKASGKLATQFTPENFIENRVYPQVHTILAFVDKNDPRGPIPANPASDPQYWSWEHPVEQWVASENSNGGHYNEPPPAEYDDVHTAANIPHIQLTSPSENERLTSRNLTLTAEAQSSRRIDRVEFYFDSYFVGSDFNPPYVYPYTLPATITGATHVFTAKAYDDLGDMAKNVRTVTIDESSGVQIENPESSPSPSADYEPSGSNNGTDSANNSGGGQTFPGYEERYGGGPVSPEPSPSTTPIPLPTPW